MDPFGGSGTTYSVCERRHRHWIGIEIESPQPIIERLTGKIDHHRNDDFVERPEYSLRQNNVPTISRREDYNGFVTKAARLNLGPLVAEAESTLDSFQLSILEEKYVNGTKGLRQWIDAAFDRLGGWKKLTSGGIDWTKQGTGGSTIGVEVQVSGRSDMLAVDIMHLKEKMLAGEIDIGLIIVPDDRLSKFLTDRTRTWLRQ